MGGVEKMTDTPGDKVGVRGAQRLQAQRREPRQAHREAQHVVLQQQRATYMIEGLRPILWQSPEGEYRPVGYVYDTARLLSLLNGTTLITTIVQLTDTWGGPHPLLLQDELQWSKRDYRALEQSIARRKLFADAHGALYETHRQLANEIGVTEASYSRHLSHV